MGKHLFEYKSKILDMAIQIAQKNSFGIGYSPDSLIEKVRSKLEITGNPERDIENILRIIEQYSKENF